jgi:hypothetical protein
MQSMGSRSATELLQLPVRLHGIRLGRPVDLLLDLAEWRALGFIVLCGDASLRFLVFAAADLQEDAIEVTSALLLLEDVEFYRDRSRSLRDVLAGELRDLLVLPDGDVEALVVDGKGGVREVRPTEVPIESERVSTA